MKNGLDLTGVFAAVQTLGGGVGIVGFEQPRHLGKVGGSYTGNHHSGRCFPFIEK
ncbi:MAG: hypothetical protein IPM07_03120 [Anaerolineales bacterium]|nr:hypothetical protein [Anaerolineales bacterium]